jgi:hypothetical protein
MGDKSSTPVYEDTILSNAFETGDLGHIGNVFTNYNERFDVWGWKRPQSIDYLKSVSEEITNPHYIIIFKDIFSEANRNVISMKSDVTLSIDKECQSYGKLIEFVRNQESPMMIRCCTIKKALWMPW